MLFYYTLGLISILALKLGHAQRINMTEKAVEYKHAEQLIHNFTTGWTLNANDIYNERQRQLTLLAEPGTYMGKSQDSFQVSAIKREDVLKMMDYTDMSDAMKVQLKKAAQTCDYYIDEEVYYDGKKIRYTRVGFMKLLHDQDNKFMFMNTIQTFGLEDIPQHTTDFLNCAARYGADESQCVLPPQMSRYDWIAFRIWFRAYGILNFMADNQPWYDSVMRALQQYLPYLPADYKPVPRCDLWPSNSSDCEQVENPKLAIVLGPVRQWNYTKMSAMDVLKVKRLIEKDEGPPEQPTINCTLDGNDVIQLFHNWLAHSHVDQEFIEELNRLISANSSQDFYAIRDLFFSPGPKKVHYARIFLVRDLLPNQYHVGSIFYQVLLRGDVTKKASIPCDTKLITCQEDKIQLTEHDHLFKQYLVQKSVEAFIGVKEEPQQSGNERKVKKHGPKGFARNTNYRLAARF